MEQFTFWIMELIFPDFSSLKPGEKAVFSFVFIYQVVTTIWGLWMIYDEKRKSWLAKKRKKQSWEKILKSK